MATHKLSILVEAIGAAKASKQLKGVDSALSSIGGRAGQGLRTAGKNIAGIGAIAAAGIAIAVKTGLDDLATLESAVTSVDGAIKTVGMTGKVTGAQIAGWANEIEANIGAAFDDKDITAATSTLIRFGKVTESNIRPAMEVMTDLAAKTGSVESASTLLAKALADPTKAAGKLARQGIILTKQQQAQIKAMVKAGDVAGAQALILDTVAKSTRGAAAASQGPYQRALSVLADVSEDARKALAEGFLPVIEKVANLLSTELAKPETIKNIREFGKGLAAGLDDLISIAKSLPWGTIGSSLKVAGAGAKAVLEAFNGMPDWVKTAILTGWGLDKLTGGALSGIAGELGKGLIKGVLGMTAGVVNINAGVVNGGGGMPGGAGDVAGNAGKTGLLGMIGTAGIVAAAGVGAAYAFSQLHHGADAGPGAYTLDPSANAFAPPKLDVSSLKNVDWAGIGKAMGGGFKSTVDPTSKGSYSTPGGGVGQEAFVKRAFDDLQKAAVSSIDSSKKETVDKLGTIDRTALTAGQTVASATTSGAAGINSTMVGNTGRLVGAIAAAKPIITTTVIVNVSGSTVTSSQTTQSRTGSSGGSRSNDDYGGSGHGKS